MKRLIPLLFVSCGILCPLFIAQKANAAAAAPAPKAEAPARNPTVSLQGDNIHINGKPTYEGRNWNGHRIEGLLYNNRNVTAFIAAMPEMKAHRNPGINNVTFLTRQTGTVTLDDVTGLNRTEHRA